MNHDMAHCSMAADGTMTMDGIPFWMAAGGVVLIILLTHGYMMFRKAPDIGRVPYWTLNLLSAAWLKRLVKWPAFPLLIQSVPLLLLSLVIVAGLFGSPKGNIAPVLTWTWWWILLIFFVAGFGKLFCAICPWEALSSMVTALSLKSRLKRITHDRPFPRWARNIWPAIGFFVLLTWLELGMDITHSPAMTAVLGLFMSAMAVMLAVVYEKRAFCRYSCPVGRISGLYALFSPVELRPADAEICRTCDGKECYHGSAKQTGCPTGLFPGHPTENTYCTLCSECVRACPHDNLALNLRPPATDLVRKNRFQWDESILAIVLLALTSFHGLTMTPVWVSANNLLRVETGLGPKVMFTLLMLLMVLLPIGLFWVTARVASALTPTAGVSTGVIFKAFAYSLIPVALFYHLAHNCMHFFMEAGNLLPLLSDPLGWGWDLFGTAKKTYGAMLSMKAIWWLQIICVVVGHVFGVVAADNLAKRLYDTSGLAKRVLYPLMFAMVLYSVFSVWLIAQPMDMRTSGM